MNIAVLASGRGSNFSAIARAVKKGKIKAKLALLICDRPAAPVLGRARRAGVKAVLIERKDFPTKKDFEQRIIQCLLEHEIGLIVLAGFMRLLSAEFVQRFSGRILNIHPSLLPAFKGTAGIRDAFDYGVKVTGVSVHFVDEELDHGPIILQGQVKIKETDSLEDLEKKIHGLEHRLYPRTIELFIQGRLKIEARKVRVIP